MFSGFTRETAISFFERRLAPAMAISFALSAGSIGYGFYASGGNEKAIVASLEEGEVEALEPEPEPEPEPEEEEIEEEPIEEIEEPVEDLPPDPRPSPVPVAPPEILPTEMPDELPEASDKASDGPRVDDRRPSGTGTGTGPRGPAKPAGEDKPKPASKKLEGDPNKPRQRVPEGAQGATPKPGNQAPEYPKPCRTRNIEGKYTLPLHIDRDGNVKGAKVIKKENSAPTEDDQKKAHTLFLKAIQAVVKDWKYTPAKYGNQTFAVWKRVTIPFNLTGG